MEKKLVREINEWDVVTLAEMVYSLKTIGAARFASERSSGTGVTALEMLDGASELLKDGPFSNNHGAAQRLIDESKSHLARLGL